MSESNTFRYLFGPVPSRRLGRSLGVDLLRPKTCTFNCVFCQLGRTARPTLERREYVPMQEVLEELERWMNAGGQADFVTLSGSGEPTLHARFGRVLEMVRERGGYRTALLTNGSLLSNADVRRQAAAAAVVKVSLGAWDDASLARLNRPHPGIDFGTLVEGIAAFREEFSGQLWLEIFLVPGINASQTAVRRIAERACMLRPDRIQLNTAVRPTAEPWVKPVSTGEMEAFARLFHPRAEVIADYRGGVAAAMEDIRRSIVNMLRRRPCTLEEITRVFALNPAEAAKYAGMLEKEGKIQREEAAGRVYFRAVGRRP